MLKTSVNGIPLAYERFGRGVPLMLLHGYPLDHSIWETLVPLLKDDFDLILPDLRGFGESQSAKMDYAMSDLAEDLANLLDQLGIKKAAMVGHSMGGYVTLACTSAHPKRLLGLSLISSQALADSPEKKIGRYQEAESVLANGVKDVAEGMSVKLTARPDLQSRLKGLILKQRPEGLAGALRAMAERPDSTQMLSGLDLPFVMVHGLDDALIPVERARVIKSAVAGAHLTEIPHAGHMPMMEEPRMTAEALLGAFIQDFLP